MTTTIFILGAAIKMDGNAFRDYEVITKFSLFRLFANSQFVFVRYKFSAGSVSVGEDIDYGKRRDFIRRPERLQQRCNVPANKVF